MWESGSAAGEASSEALDAQGAGDSQTAAEEPLTESEAASTANNYVEPAQGPGGFHTGAGSRIKSGCVPVRGDVQCGERCGSYIK